MVTLSRYFYENVEFIANMCPKCYEECCDVQLISVNKAFLEQVHRKSPQKSKIPDWLSCISQMFKTNRYFLGFNIEEGQKSKTYSDKMQKILKDIRDDLRNFEIHRPRNNECFEGFSSNDVKHSRLYHQRVKRTCDLMRYKIFERLSVSINRNIKKRRLKRRSKTAKETVKNWTRRHSIAEENEREFRLGTSRYFGNDGNSNDNLMAKENERGLMGGSRYFGNNGNFNNNLMDPSESTKPCLVTEIGSNYNEDCALETENDIFSRNAIKRESFHYVSSRSTEEKKSEELFYTEIGTVDYESEYYRIIENATESIHITEFSSKFVTRHSWIPPRSPHNLIEESLVHDPWALLTATIFLNKTSCMLARPFVFWFLMENPDPFKVLDKFPKDLEKYFCDLGLQRTRAVQVYRMSYDFLFKDWRSASELYGIGNYGESAFRMFCLGDFSVEPKDRFLKIYKAWYQKLHLKR